jgi:hypothetical protein
MPTVYNFRRFEPTLGETVWPPAKRTAEQIKELKGDVLWESAEYVEEKDLGPDGSYVPPIDIAAKRDGT